MSEPDGAFLKLHLVKSHLVKWLDSPVPLASTWQDWSSIGGQWYFTSGLKGIEDLTADEVKAEIAECDERLKVFSDNRAALRQFALNADAPHLKYVAYLADNMDFMAGTLTYSENLHDFIVFLTIARGATAFLDNDEHGVAVIHNYIWGEAEERTTQAALRLESNGRSSFIVGADNAGASQTFQPIADKMLSGEDAFKGWGARYARSSRSAEPIRPLKLPEMPDELEGLR